MVSTVARRASRSAALATRGTTRRIVTTEAPLGSTLGSPMALIRPVRWMILIADSVAAAVVDALIRQA